LSSKKKVSSATVYCVVPYAGPLQSLVGQLIWFVHPKEQASFARAWSSL
jgi:hypothetical protein